jgi:hypothetical protein
MHQLGPSLAIDEHGVRFLLSLRIWAFLRKSASPEARPTEMTHRDWSWALHSHAHDILLDAVVNVAGGPQQTSWPLLRGSSVRARRACPMPVLTRRAVGGGRAAAGVGWWLSSHDALRRVLETVAKNQFMAKEDHDPVDCSLLYLALGKRKVCPPSTITPRPASAIKQYFARPCRFFWVCGRRSSRIRTTPR